MLQILIRQATESIKKIVFEPVQFLFTQNKMASKAGPSCRFPPLYKSFVGKRNALKERTVQALPPVNPSGQRHVGIFTGRSIEVVDPEAIRELHENGCFGISTVTKGKPLCLRKGPPVESRTTDKLLLFPEEALFLSYSLKCLEIRTRDGTPMSAEDCLAQFSRIHPGFVSSFIVYTYLRSKNWVVKSGIKFGGDFCKATVIGNKIYQDNNSYPFLLAVVYRRGPDFFHATYSVLVRTDGDAQVDPVQLQCIHRVTQTSGKEVLLLQVTPKPLQANHSEYLQTQFSAFTVTDVIPRRFILK